MEEIIVIVLQFLFELLLDVGTFFPFDLPSKNRRTPEPSLLALGCCFWFAGGCACGWLATFVFKNTLIASGALRMVNLVVAPLVSAALSQAIAKRRARDNHHIRPRNHYWRAFWFTTGLVAVRFVYAARG
jgi:hypothetical protein